MKNMTLSSSRVSRRRAMFGSAALVTGAALAAPAIAQGAPRVLRIATSWPEGLGGLADSVKRVAEGINRSSGGALEVQIGWAGQFVGPLAVHDAAGAGEIDMYHSVDYYFQKKHRGLNFFSTVPFGLTSVEQAAWTKFGGGQELWDELNAGYGVKSLPVGGTGVQMGGWFNKDIDSIEDFEGLTMRMPGLGGQVLAKLGANPVVLPGGGIVEALFDGSIDATEWVGPYNDLHFGFQKLLSNYYYPGFHEPGTMAAVGFGLDVWNSFSDSERAVIQMVIDAELTLHTADYYGNNGIALAQMLREDGVTPKRLPDDVWDALAKASEEVVSSVAEDDDMGRRIFESYDAYRQKVGSVASISQADYLAKRGATDLFAEV